MEFFKEFIKRFFQIEQIFFFVRNDFQLCSFTRSFANYRPKYWNTYIIRTEIYALYLLTFLLHGAESFLRS